MSKAATIPDQGALKRIGAQVRQRLESGGPWEELVPEAVARIIKALRRDSSGI